MAARRRRAEFDSPQETEAYLEGREKGPSGSRTAPARSDGSAPAVVQRRSSRPVKDGFWAVIAMLLGVGLFALLDGRATAGFWIALLAVALVGAVVPPLAIGFLALVLLYLLMTHGPVYMGRLQQLGQAIGGIFSSSPSLGPGASPSASSAPPSMNGVPLGELRTAAGP